MNNDSNQTKEELLQEINRLRNEVALLKSTRQQGEKTTQLLRKSMKELADLKRALDESTLFNITNREGKIIYANEKFCQLTGYTKDELFGRTHSVVKSGYHPKKFFNHMWETIMLGEIWRGEIKNKAKDGRYFWVDTTIVPLLNDEGQPKYFLGIRADVTRQKVIESQLEGQQDISRKFMEVSGGIFVFIDKDQSVCMVNEKGSEALGYSVNEIIGKNWFTSCIPEHVRGWVTETYNKLINGQLSEAEYLEIPVITRAGQQREIVWHVTPVTNGDGHIIGTLSSGIDITDRKQAEKALQRSESFIRAVLSSLTAHIAVLDSNGAIIAANAAWERMALASKHKTLIRAGVGANYLDVCRQSPAVYASSIVSGIQAVLDGALKEFTFEYPCHAPDQEQWFLLYVTPLALESSDGAVISQINITKRKQVEKKLKESEARYRSVVEDQTEFIVRWSRDEKLTYVNESYCRYFGKTREELIGTDFMPAMPEEDHNLVHQHLDSLRDGNPVSTCEHRVVLPDGSIGWTHWSSRAIFNEEKELVEVQSVGRDITDKKNAEQELLDSEKRFRSLIATAGNIIIYLSADFRILEWNYEAERVFKWTRDEVIGRNYFAICNDGSGRETIYDDLKRIGGVPLRGIETQIKTKNGASRHLIWNCSRLQNCAGQSNGFILIGDDITERKHAEAELERAREQLMVQTLYSQRLSALATMASGIAHELNQPLSSIRVYSESIKNLKKKGGAQQLDKISTIINKIIAQVDRASHVIEHIREFASEETNQPVQKITIRQAVDNVASLIGGQLLSQRIKFSNEVNADHQIQINQTRLEQVLFNLIANAKDSFEQKAPHPPERKEIRVTSTVDGHHVIVRVHDNGGGVPKEIRQNLMEPFVTTKGPDQGMGLGLSICYGILRDCNATIELESTSENGAILKLCFPRV